jgi:hypothetical protein
MEEQCSLIEAAGAVKDFRRAHRSVRRKAKHRLGGTGYGSLYDDQMVGLEEFAPLLQEVETSDGWNNDGEVLVKTGRHYSILRHNRRSQTRARNVYQSLDLKEPTLQELD